MRVANLSTFSVLSLSHFKGGAVIVRNSVVKNADNFSEYNAKN